MRGLCSESPTYGTNAGFANLAKSDDPQPGVPHDSNERSGLDCCRAVYYQAANRVSYYCCTLESGLMADTLDQDVQALKEWQASAWRFLADPSSTRFERQELRNYMKEADAALRAGLQRIAARETARKDRYGNYSWAELPDFRVLNIER